MYFQSLFKAISTFKVHLKQRLSIINPSQVPGIMVQSRNGFPKSTLSRNTEQAKVEHTFHAKWNPPRSPTMSLGIRTHPDLNANPVLSHRTCQSGRCRPDRWSSQVAQCSGWNRMEPKSGLTGVYLRRRGPSGGPETGSTVGGLRPGAVKLRVAFLAESFFL